MSKKSKMAAKPSGSAETGASPIVSSKAATGARSAILDLLKRQGELSASDVGATLGITPMGARQHLFELEDEGLLSSRSEPRGRGRPVKLWALTDSSARVFPDAHQGLAVEMIQSVEELFGRAGLDKFIKKHGDRQRAIYGEQLKGAKSLGERVKRLAVAREAEGYMAEAQQDGRDWLLIENHCPICSAAKACTGICAGELKVFSDVLGKGAQVEREEHILAGARRCAYRVTPTKYTD